MSMRMKVWKEYSQSHLYNYEFHKQFSKDLEDLGGISKEFMTLPPASVSDSVWDDIVRMRTLNLNQYNKKREGHVCPLQIQLVERCINQYTNKGEIVFDPFAGIFTVPMVAVQLGRYGMGTEIHPPYWEDGVSYCQDAENEISSPTLFDFLERDEQ
jgi:DNA modification methylase